MEGQKLGSLMAIRVSRRQALRPGTSGAGPPTRSPTTALRLEPRAVDGADQRSQQQIRRAAEHHDRQRQQDEGN